jgi:hypothetical protein
MTRPTSADADDADRVFHPLAAPPPHSSIVFGAECARLGSEAWMDEIDRFPEPSMCVNTESHMYSLGW